MLTGMEAIMQWVLLKEDTNELLILPFQIYHLLDLMYLGSFQKWGFFSPYILYVLQQWQQLNYLRPWFSSNSFTLNQPGFYSTER